MDKMPISPQMIEIFIFRKLVLSKKKAKRSFKKEEKYLGISLSKEKMINVKNFQESRQEKEDTLFAIHHMELSFSERGLGLFRNVFCHEVTQLLSYHHRNLST